MKIKYLYLKYNKVSLELIEYKAIDIKDENYFSGYGVHSFSDDYYETLHIDIDLWNKEYYFHKSSFLNSTIENCLKQLNRDLIINELWK